MSEPISELRASLVIWDHTVLPATRQQPWQPCNLGFISHHNSAYRPSRSSNANDFHV